MPGYSTECVSGAHQACTTGSECRCQCHQHTQQLIAKGPGKPDPKGGIRRKRLKNVVTLPTGENVAVEEAPVKCSCGVTARAGDNYCRKCGTRLQGKECDRCGMGGESADIFCAACGWRYGDKIPEQVSVPVDTTALKAELRTKLKAAGVTVPSIETEIPEEDPVVRLRREAVERGLLHAR